jgi:hypothetical protein
MPRPSNQTLEQRLWSRIAVGDPRECWAWEGSHNPRGLPYFVFAARDRGDYNLRQRFGTRSISGITAQRVLWGLTVGDVPYKRVIYHTCGNRGCMNPNHLCLGTKQDQADHRVDSGRRAVGLRNGKAKLTPHVASQIYELYFSDNELTQKEIADRFGFVGSTVSNICSGHSWSHATEATPTFKYRKMLTTEDQHNAAWFNKNHDPRWRE